MKIPAFKYNINAKETLLSSVFLLLALSAVMVFSATISSPRTPLSSSSAS